MAGLEETGWTGERPRRIIPFRVPGVAVPRNQSEVVRQYSEVREVLARPEELIEVWTNLVKNAMQAVEYRGVLTVTVREQGGYALVSIADTGPGVPAGLREKIFAPFFTTKATGVGTGLGLGIVARIVTAHDGTVEVVESAGGGAEFVVRLPLAPATRDSPSRA